jgi:hypothetical protein
MTAELWIDSLVYRDAEGKFYTCRISEFDEEQWFVNRKLVQPETVPDSILEAVRGVKNKFKKTGH